MRKTHLFLFISIWLVLLPFLGFPYSWKDILTTLSGLILVFLSCMLLKEDKKNGRKGEETFENFSENHDFEENKSNDNKTQ